MHLNWKGIKKKMGEFIFLEQSIDNGNINDPLNMAKHFFIKKDFEKIISILEPVIKSTKYNYEYKMACISNLAMAYHVRGYYEYAKEYYEKCDETIMSAINYYAFCHRYFEYKKISYKPYIGELKQIFEHNQLNYFLNVFGADAAVEFWENRSLSIYDEQIFNSIKERQGDNIDIRVANKYEKKFLEQSKWILHDIPKEKRTKKKIGIFLTDLQRHKPSSIVYQMVEELYSEFEIIIYFNNIFQNKLIKSLQKWVCLKDVSHMNYGEVINLMNSDSISLLIDMAEYGLRNNSIAISNSAIKRVSLSDVIDRKTLIVSSDSYFSNVNYIQNKNSKILVLGDLRFVKNQDLYNIKDKYKNREIVFESQALDETLFKENFIIRLKKCGFNMNKIFVQRGMLPFSAYMQFISSFEKILLLPSVTITELSEVIRTGVDYEYVSTCKIIRNKPEDSSSFLEIIKKIVEETNREREEKRTIIKDLDLCFCENGKHYYINCTCNGDLLFFDDIVEKRYEYINTI